MTVLDTDVLTLVLRGIPVYLALLGDIPADEVRLPIVAIEEVFRGRLDAIRKAQQLTRADALPLAYNNFEADFILLGRYVTIAYTPAAHTIFLAWRTAKVRIGTQDLRIAAICVAHDATLVSRNRRDFDKVPELKLSVWN